MALDEGADFNSICTHQYKEFLGLGESMDECMHTDESSSQFIAQLMGGGNPANVASGNDIMARIRAQDSRSPLLTCPGSHGCA